MWRIAVKRTIGGEVEEQDEDLGVLNPKVHQAFWTLPQFNLPFFPVRSLPDSKNKKPELEREKKCMGHPRAWFPTASGKKASNSFRKQQVHHIKAILVP